MKYYVFKLNAPRADFVSAMTPAELALTQMHGAYLKRLMDRSQAVVFGPVLDPAGAYGLTVIRLEDEVAPKMTWGKTQ